jgi:NAD+ diphosphatase
MDIPTLFTPTIGPATAFDRDPARRADAAALDRLAREPGTRFLVIVNARALIRSDAERTVSSILWLAPADAEHLAFKGAFVTRLYLGRDAKDGSARFAHIISAADPEHGGAPWAPLPGPLVDLRSLAMQGVMPAAEMSLIGEALMLANWHESARYCGRCGSPTTVLDGGWKRICSSGLCRREVFPRIDPVVIMLVTDRARCVLSREARFPPGMVSTLAGFIEPGEDIAHAVRRETFEEIGVTTGEVRFVASQPWPFAHSLMIGCIAEAETYDLKPDPAEIDAAAWYGASEVRAILGRRPSDGEPWLPGKQSLANVLVETWLAELGMRGA